jgi:glycosyltransferase involved in cell wall biosynthesis
MDRKPMLLWVGDAYCHTGFARVTHNVLDQLQHLWDIKVLGINYNGDPHPYDYSIFPARAGGDVFGLRRYQTLVEKLQPDVVCLLNDPWIVTKFLQLRGNGRERVAAYMPVDGLNLSDGELLNDLDLAIWYTDFGRRQAESGGYGGPSRVIPHGVDRGLYSPRDRRECRQRLGLGSLPIDAFIVGNINRNAPRKRLDLTVKYFAEWVKQYQLPGNIYLFIHANRKDVGCDFHDLARFYGIDSRMIVTPDLGCPGGAVEDEMPLIYGALDIQISTTQGEGWGLTQMEGMSCGIPQIVPNWSGLAEWAERAALFVPCTGTAARMGGRGEGSATIGGIADESAFIAALDEIYRNLFRRYQLAQAGLARVSEPRFQWPAIGALFHEALITLTRSVGEDGDALTTPTRSVSEVVDERSIGNGQCLPAKAAEGACLAGGGI